MKENSYTIQTNIKNGEIVKIFDYVESTQEIDIGDVKENESL